MLISVICPLYNEVKHIEPLIQFFLHSMPAEKELLLVDGLSTDGTRAIIEKYITQYPGKIKLLDNPQKHVPFALNLAIKEATGSYIARLDAHTLYPSNYFEVCMEESLLHGATNVGGHITAKGEGDRGAAIAYSMSCKFGVGNSDFRTVIKDGYVDTVPFGFWKRTVFDEMGLFDEQLKRNQDDEFNARTISLGGTVYQSSKICSEYYVRNSLSKLGSQYFQYGLYKPLVLKKVKSAIRLRHLVPAFFVLYIVSLPLAYAVPVLLLPLLMYGALALYFSFKNSLTVKQKFLALLVFPTLHLSYGAGFIVGLFKK